MLSLFARSDVSPVVVLIVIGIVGFVILSNARAKRRDWERRLGHLAFQLGGTLELDGWFGPPVTRFVLSDRPAILAFRSGRQPSTELRVALPQHPGGSLRICRGSFTQFFITLLNGGRLKVGDRLFDSMYVVRSAPESLGRRIFAPARLQEAMTAVRRLISCSGLTIDIQPSRMAIRIAEGPDASDMAMAMVRTAKDFLRFMFEAAPEPGVECGDLFVKSAGRCPICSTSLIEPLVRCERCLAPHHQDCWDYAGRCATYGCDPTPGRRVA